MSVLRQEGLAGALVECKSKRKPVEPRQKKLKSVIGALLDAVEEETEKREKRTLGDWLLSVGGIGSKRKCERVAEVLHRDGGYTSVRSLCTDKHLKESLDKKELKAIKPGQRSAILNAAEAERVTFDSTPFVLAFMGGCDLNVRHEEELLREGLLGTGLGLVRPEGSPCVSSMLRLLAKHQEARLLHLAMHGDARTSAGRRSLHFPRKAGGELAEPTDLAEHIAKHSRTRGRRGSSDVDMNLECVVLNSCASLPERFANHARHSREGGGLADKLYDEHNAMCVVYWDSAVVDEAAIVFSEGFYRFLGSWKRDKHPGFEAAIAAFRHAEEHLKNYGQPKRWLLDVDPSDEEDQKAVRRRRVEEGRPKLQAAGKLRMRCASTSVKKYDAFLSHSKKRGETPRTVTHVKDVLEERGLHCFMDVDDINGNKKISTELLQEEIEASRVFVIFLDDKTLDSKWCRDEVAHAEEVGLPLHVVVDAQKHDVAELIAHWEKKDDETRETIWKLKGAGSHQFIKIGETKELRKGAIDELTKRIRGAL